MLITNSCFQSGLYRAETALFRVPEKNIPNIFKETSTETETEEDDEREKSIRCAGCGYKITTPEYRMEINGRHRHVFNNPAGIIFEIGCFSAAEGCANRGASTMEFTWFTGYAWRFTVCGYCHNHLGWFYQSTGSGFYGLILSQLIEDD